MARHGGRSRAAQLTPKQRQIITAQRAKAETARRAGLRQRTTKFGGKGERFNVSLSALRAKQQRFPSSNTLRANINFRESGGTQQQFQAIVDRQEANRRISQRRGAGISATAIRAALPKRPTPTASPSTILTSQASRPTPQVSLTDQGFQGDVGRVGVPRGILSPTSKFEIIGGKAVPKGAVAKDFGARLGGEQFGFSRVPTTTKSGTPIPDNIRQVFGQERNVSLLVAQDFISKRNAALASGATIKEAQALAIAQTRGLPKSEQEAINTTLQKQIIERKAGQLKLAEQLIKEQTTTGTTGQLDDLKGALAKAEPIPATVIKVSVDSEGKDINPRRTNVLVNNALLTGNKIEDLDIIFHQDPTALVNDRGGFISLSPTGETIIDTDRLIQKLNPRSIDVILGSEQNVFESVVKDVQKSKTGSERLLDAQRGFTRLSKKEIVELTTEGETLKQIEVSQGQINKLVEAIIEQGGILAGTGTEDDPFRVELPSGETLPLDDVRVEELLIALELASRDIESLQDFNTELLRIIEELRGGQFTSDLLSSLFSLIAELQAQLGSRQQPLEEEFIDPFEGITNFFGDIYLGFLNLFGVKA